MKGKIHQSYIHAKDWSLWRVWECVFFCAIHCKDERLYAATKIEGVVSFLHFFLSNNNSQVHNIGI